MVTKVKVHTFWEGHISAKCSPYYVVSVKNKENISQDVAAFSEYMQHCSYLEFSSPLKKQTNYCTGPDYICTTIYSIKQTETYNWNYNAVSWGK